MSDKSSYKWLGLISHFDWSTNTEYVHGNYKWLIKPLSASGSFECETYQNKKIIRRNLILNERVDSDKSINFELNHIYNQTITSIPRCTIVNGDILFAPLGTKWARIIADSQVIAIVLSYYNDIIKITHQCTFNSNVSLPFGLPLFNSTLEKIVAFVGRRLTNGRYVIDADSPIKMYHHILSDEKVSIEFFDCINTAKDQEIEIARKRVDLYGNRLYDNGLKTQELRQLELQGKLTDIRQRRVNILQSENAVIITITNGQGPDAAQLQRSVFRNSTFVKYFVLPPIEEFVVEEEEDVHENKPKKNKK